jgi:hypothetical protein
MKGHSNDVLSIALSKDFIYRYGTASNSGVDSNRSPLHNRRFVIETYERPETTLTPPFCKSCLRVAEKPYAPVTESRTWSAVVGKQLRFVTGSLIAAVMLTEIFPFGGAILMCRFLY